MAAFFVVMTRKPISFRRQHTRCDCRYDILNKIPTDRLAALSALAQAHWDAQRMKRMKSKKKKKKKTTTNGEEEEETEEDESD